MTRFKPHPAAELFPMMTEPELTELAADIKARGQLHPIIVTTDGLVLDGRNRLAACEIAGVEPDTLMWDREDDGMSPTAWVLSVNLHRRHLNESQRGLIAAKALELFQKEARARQRSGTSVPRGTKVGRAVEHAAETVGVGGRTVARAKAVLEKAPKERVEAINAGKATLKQVEREMKRAEQREQIAVYRPPEGRFSVIVADPPWQYEDTLDGSDAARGGTPYPTMTLEQICALQVGEKHAAPDCALWLWVTNSHLIDGSAATVLKAWGFEPKTMLTWVKDRWGAGRYLRNQTEHVILAVRGKPAVFGEKQGTYFEADRTEHSEKPDYFFAIASAVTPAPETARLELFARKPRPSWTTFGAELPKGRKLKVVDVTEAA